MFIEAPVGVGFSYSDSGNYSCDDDRTALENMAAVEQFFQLFPELRANPLYITGESYAGV
jgi:carboxypeptidase C (cathepsin A)